MNIAGKVAVVTGGGNGIGRALCERFAADGADAVVVSDIDEAAAHAVAEQIGGTAIGCDVAQEDQIARLVEQTLNKHGRIDVFISNAGITAKGGVEIDDADWMRLWNVNVMSRVFAARAVVPHMLERGEGYMIQVASAAALVTEIGSAGYTVTKHADLGLAEWLAVQYGKRGVRVSCVCPLGVETDMLDHEDPVHQFLAIQSITAADVAESIVSGIEKEQFLILPHPQVAEFFQLKADDHDRWVRGMQRLNEKLTRWKQKHAA